MSQLTPRFSADRTVREYTEQHYLPAATAYLDRSANKGEKGKQMTDAMDFMKQKWDSLRFGEIKLTTIEDQHNFNVQIFLIDLDPDLVQVELFADGANGEPPTILKMKRETISEATTKTYYYYASVSSVRPASDYTPRIITDIPGVSVPLESALILWQH